jgi:hypothetical protein
VVNNLYGVDIMAEAVEIARLRFFLKLAAQVDRVEDIEPLPDIDFNIRAGNTLVGFTTVAEVERAMKIAQSGQRKLMFGEDVATLQRIEEKAQDVNRLFGEFQAMQTAHDMREYAQDFMETKEELRKRLKALEGELNRYLAQGYGVDVTKPAAYQKWLASHQPFHWFTEFYGILKQGGFDVIIGNPPYVEYKKVKKEYTIRGYATEDCGNLYAFMMERSLDLKAIKGRCGMIVPLSGHSTDRMKSLITEFYDKARLLHLMNLSADAHPSVLFPGARFRLSIFLYGGNQAEKALYTTKYTRWFAEARSALLDEVEYAQTSLRLHGVLPKISSPIHDGIMSKLLQHKGSLGIHSGKNITYYHNAPVHWIRAHAFVPYFHSERDGEKVSTQLKPLKFTSKEQALAASGVVCSSLFFIWWLTVSDCYHLNKREVNSFPVDLSDMSLVRQLAPIAKRLNDDMLTKSRRRVYVYKTSGRVEYDEFYLKLSKPVIDEIDHVLAQHYGFTDEELDFIINYEIKYRMGDQLPEEEGEEE